MKTKFALNIGFVSRIGEFPESEWEKEFALAGKLGISHLELIINYPFLGPLTYTKEQLERLKQLALKNKIALILHLLPNQYQLPKEVRYSDCPEKFQEHEDYLKEKIFNLASENEQVRRFSIEEVKRTIIMVESLGAELITIHGGSFSEEEYKPALNRARKSLEYLNPVCRNVKLCVENLPVIGHFGKPVYELPIEAKDLIYLVNGLENIGICLDIGHANNVENIFTFYEQLRTTGKIWDMHIHDNKRDKDDHLQLGKGNINWRGFIELLKKENYQGYFSLELDTWNEYPEAMESGERVEALKYLGRIEK